MCAGLELEAPRFFAPVCPSHLPLCVKLPTMAFGEAPDSKQNQPRSKHNDLSQQPSAKTQNVQGSESESRMPWPSITEAKHSAMADFDSRVSSSRDRMAHGTFTRGTAFPNRRSESFCSRSKPLPIPMRHGTEASQPQSSLSRLSRWVSGSKRATARSSRFPGYTTFCIGCTYGSRSRPTCATALIHRQWKVARLDSRQGEDC
jgi:hypothetical protein